MNLMFYTMLFILLMSSFIMMLASMLSKKTIIDREKNSPFECGFDPNSSSRMPFSLQFFLITIIFLIFDIEIALIMPMIIVMKYSNLIHWSVTSIIFITILLLGLYHEWSQGILEWTT